MHQPWPNQAEHKRIEAIAIMLRIEEMADAAFNALERGDPIETARHLGQIKNRATTAKTILKNQREHTASFDKE